MSTELKLCEADLGQLLRTAEKRQKENFQQQVQMANAFALIAGAIREKNMAALERLLPTIDGFSQISFLVPRPQGER